MSLTCRQPGHIPHIWPPLPLTQNHMIFSCEQFCQWCPVVAKDLKYVNQSPTGYRPTIDHLLTT